MRLVGDLNKVRRVDSRISLDPGPASGWRIAW
jgi:hypothetical protein